MRRILVSLAAAIGLVLFAPELRAAIVTQAKDLSVTVSYKGKGPVDATHDILVFLFTDPNITNQSRPIAVQAIPKNGGTAVFKDVTPELVYVVMVYNEKGNYDGTSGPPPAGLPIGIHSKGGKPIGVKPADNAKITTSFTDAKRWGQ